MRPRRIRWKGLLQLFAEHASEQLQRLAELITRINLVGAELLAIQTARFYC